MICVPISRVLTFETSRNNRFKRHNKCDKSMYLQLQSRRHCHNNITLYFRIIYDISFFFASHVYLVFGHVLWEPADRRDTVFGVRLYGENK